MNMLVEDPSENAINTPDNELPNAANAAQQHGQIKAETLNLTLDLESHLVRAAFQKKYGKRDSNFIKSGRCKSSLKSGIYAVPCPCDGSFHEQDSIDAKCFKCDHPIASHAAAHETGNGQVQTNPDKPSKSRMTIRPGNSSRKQLVQSIISQLAETELLLVRSPPSTGKTTLGELVHDHILAHTSLIPILYTWHNKTSDFWWAQDVVDHNRGHGIDAQNLMKSRNLVLIIDEAQLSYSDENFWIEYVKNKIVPGNHSKCLMLSSHGSASPITVQFTELSSPIMLGGQHKVSLGVRPEFKHGLAMVFTFEELQEVARNMAELQSPHIIVPDDILKRILSISSGHPGACSAIIQSLTQEPTILALAAANIPIPTSVFTKLLNDDHLLFEFIDKPPCYRSLLNVLHFLGQPHIMRILQEAVTKPMLRDLNMQAWLRSLSRDGLLQAEYDREEKSVFYYWPSELHMKFAANCLKEGYMAAFECQQLAASEELRKHIEATKNSISEAEDEKAKLEGDVKSQGLTPADIDRLNSEKEKLLKTLEQVYSRLEDISNTVEDRELAATTKFEALYHAVERYNVLAYRIKLPDNTNRDFELQLLPGNESLSYSDPDKLIKNANAGYQPQDVLNQDLRNEVRPALTELKRQIGKRIHDFEEDYMRTQDQYEQILEKLSEKSEEIATLKSKKSALEEEYNEMRETTSTEAISSNAEIEKLERKLQDIRVGMNSGSLSLDQRMESIRIEYDQLLQQLETQRELLRSETNKIMGEIVNFKIHIQTELEKFEEEVVKERDAGGYAQESD